MKETVYLVVAKTGVKGMWKRPPGRKAGEIVVSLTLAIPDVAFEPVDLGATLTVSEDDIQNPLHEMELEIKRLKELGEE